MLLLRLMCVWGLKLVLGPMFEELMLVQPRMEPHPCMTHDEAHLGLYTRARQFKAGIHVRSQHMFSF